MLPQPRKIQKTEGRCSLPIAEASYVTDADDLPPQGYRISITSDAINVDARDRAGAFYAEQTLKQLVTIHGKSLPCCEIEDWPDFPARGVMLDVSRDKVPTMGTMYELIDLFASWKINQIQLYIEHTFAYQQHKTVWAKASPFTADEIQALDRYCHDRFIELVPNQNSFGHMERWLKHPEYVALAEAPEGAPTPWGFVWHGPFSICPTDPKSIPFLTGLFDEYLPNFTSNLFNVGCDETFDIGAGRSKQAVAERGVHGVYFDFLKSVYKLVDERDRRMMFWGDIIRKAPELIGELHDQMPNAIALSWDYEAKNEFENDGRMFAEAEVPFYVCPGTSSWCTITGRTDVMLENTRTAAEAGLKHGAIGFLTTDWGDHGHLQYLPVSYAGFAAAAAFSWCMESNQQLNLAKTLNLFAFKDPTGQLGRIAVEMGNVYQSTGKIVGNSSSLFRILVPPQVDPGPAAGMTAEGLDAAEKAIDRAMRDIDQVAPGLVVDEFKNGAAMLKFAIALGRHELGGPAPDENERQRIIQEHIRLWMCRNRPGGLDDSIARIRG